MTVKVVLVDVNPMMVQAWREVFEANPEVEIRQGSMVDQAVDAWVSPTNVYGSMGGGLDGVIKRHLGARVQMRVQREIALRYGGSMPLGTATCVEVGTTQPRFLISTPTMERPSEDIRGTLNVALACSAALQIVHMQNARTSGAIASVALPGLGARTGKVPVQVCADLMWAAYSLFRDQAFTDFVTMRQALEDELGALGVASAHTVARASRPVGAANCPTMVGSMYGRPASRVPYTGANRGSV